MNDALRYVAAGKILTGRFSTDHIPLRDRHDIWRNCRPRSVAQMFETTPVELFATQADYVRLDTLELIFSCVSGQAYDRTRKMVSADGIDHLGVSVRFEGAARGEMDGESVAAPAGSILLTDLARAQKHESEPFSGVSMTLPRAFAESFLPSVRDLHGFVVPPDSAALLRGHLVRLHHSAATTSATAGARLARTVIDLLAVAVAEVAPAQVTTEARETAAKIRAKAMIESRLTSATLTVESLCRVLSMSRSSLYRLFEAEGGVLAYVRDRRIERVAAALRDPDNSERIAALADRFGFSDATYLTRVFRQVYGTTPGAFRAGHSGSD
jgi:AraC-like DNA-binding protein